jgi:hypothetical protein
VRGCLLKVRWDFFFFLVSSHLVGIDKRLAGDEINDSPQLFLTANRNLERYRSRSQPRLYRLHRVPEVGSRAVHLVDETDARHFVAVRLVPDRLRLGLHASHPVQHDDPSV